MCLNYQDNLKRRFYSKNELHYFFKRSVFLNFFVKFTIKLKVYKFKSFFFFSRIKNRCIYSGRAKGILPFFRASRICVRENLCKGFYAGFYSRSW